MFINSLAWIGQTEILIVVGVLILLFGGKKIPELMRGVGQGVGELQKGLEDGRRQLNASIQETKASDDTSTK